jgi:hypothetical protein
VNAFKSSPHRAEKAEDLICQLKDVISAHVTEDEEGLFKEIHVVAKPGRDTKKIVRDIESMLLAQLSVRVDHKTISIAQISEDEQEKEAPAEKPKGGRLKLEDMDLTVSDLLSMAKVRLSKNGVEAEGTASGPKSKRNQLRLTAAATLDAVRFFLSDQHVLAVEDLATVTAAGQTIVVVVVSLVSARAEKLFVGSALARDDLLQAVTFATLDAVNRCVGMLAASQLELQEEASASKPKTG